jgi:hypothetical protein
MMNWLRERLRRWMATKQKATAVRARPTLEPLEDRLTEDIVNSPFMDALHNAGYGVGRGRVSGSTMLGPGNVVAGATVTDQRVQHLLALDILKHEVPPPDANRLYTVFLPPNVTFTAAFGGKTFSSNIHHGNLAGWNNTFNIGGAKIHYVVIPYPGGTNGATNGDVSTSGQGNRDAITEALSHEIAEAVVGRQIADHTQHWHYRMRNGVAIEEVGRPNNLKKPVPVAGATPLKDISGWGTPS